MDKKNFIRYILISFIFLFGINQAQDNGIYVPPRIQKIYDGNTRSWDGRPGEEYWQNSSDYYLRVELDTETNLVSGEGNIIYHNSSPDTLNKIVFRLYQDIFKKGVARDSDLDPRAITDGTEIKYLAVNGNELDPDSVGSRTATNFLLLLPKPLLPGDQVEIEAKWQYTLANVQPIRMGKYRDGGFFVSYWYPQVAVYDDVDGWDLKEYTGQVEFYNDVNNFEVEITTPENYLVRATGEMQNGENILKGEIYSRYKKALVSEDVIEIITPDDLKEGNITSKGKQTWYYKASNVPDFTFACVKDYLWDGVAAQLDEEPGKMVFTDVLYKEEDPNFNEGAAFSKIIVEYLSNELPGVQFPYSHITSFCNGRSGGGMESPMMTNDGAPEIRVGLFSLLLHEIAHTYYPFYMGINERKYGWMDEGWATFLTKDLVAVIDSNYNHYNNIFGRYSSVFGEDTEVPLMILSNLVKDYSLTAAIYGRAFFAYVALQDLLGEDLFKKALKEYMHRWAGKHPLPYDFFFAFNDVAKEDLSWFWNPWFYGFGYCDLGLEQKKNGEYIVKFLGNLPVSFEVIITYDNGERQLINETAAVWKDGITEFKLDAEVNRKIKSIEINDNRIPDLNPKNNIIIIN